MLDGNSNFKDFYEVLQTIYETDRLLVCRAESKADHRAVILKLLKRSRERRRDVERFRNAYNIGTKINHSAIETLALESSQEGLLLVFADDHSETLETQISESIGLPEFLKLIINVTEAVAHLHSQGVIHCDLKPQNILVQPKTGEIKLMDFELSAYLPREQQIMPNPSLMEASLPYMSPEQTGKTNHAIDVRSDLYSLGIIFYQLWLGRLPFQAEDPLGWIYNHLTTTPASLFNIRPQTPVVVSEIIDKLLKKDPDDRYQSALGLQRDLQRCLDTLALDGTVPTFALGQKDVSNRLQIPHRLYGREKEVSQLLQTFDHFSENGKPELVLISGYSGVGKTSLIRELHKPLVKRRGFFLNGKFDQLKKGIPYATLSQAFRGFVLELLAEPEEQISYWKNKIQAALGNNAQLLIGLIPEVELIIGPQAPVPEAALAEEENRFRSVIRQFLMALTSEQHPIVLVLDDLQWADQASLKFIQDVLTNNEVNFLFLIGAYRDNEVTPSHPLALAIASLKQDNAAVSELVLSSLSQEHLGKLIADTLHKSLKDVEPLARVIYSKTAGNPFFFTQLLISLHQDKLIYFDQGQQEWKWNLETIRQHKHADNVVDLLVERLRKLPMALQDTLALAACVGNTFSSDMLVLISGRTEESVSNDLWSALGEGIILQTQSEYRFLHDRVQQVALNLLTPEQRQLTHLRIGRQWLLHVSKNELSEHIFDITNQMNQGILLIDDQQERDKLAELNLKAAQRARQSAAYEPAVSYLMAGMSLLDEETWQRNFDLQFALFLERAQSEYLSKNFGNAEKYFNMLLARGRNRTEMAAIYAIGIQLYSNQANMAKALELTLSYMALFDIHLPEKPTLEQVDTEVHKILNQLQWRSIESLSNLPVMTDPERKALLSIVLVSLPASYITNEKLWALTVCLSVSLCLTYGNSENSSLAYSTFSMVLGAFFQKYQEGARFGQVAIELAQRYPTEAINSAVYTTVGSMVTHWVKPFKEGSPLIRRAHQIGAETGNQTWACYACNLLISSLLSEGLPLSEIQKEAESSLDFATRAKFPTQVNGVVTNQLYMQWLRGGTQIDEASHEANLLSVQWPIELCWFYIRKLQALFIFGEYEKALAAAKKAAPLLWTSSNFMQVADYSLFHALSLLQLGRTEGVQKHIEELQVWQKSCPENFSDKLMLVLAEKARIEGKTLDAEHFYEKAIQAAKKNGFNHIEAIGHELAAKFYAKRGFVVTAEAYLQEARACYMRWEANAKVTDLESKYKFVRKVNPFRESDTFTARIPDLDFFSVIKASQTVSGKILPGDLSETLLTVVMEHAAAQKGCLILVDHEQLKIVATSRSDNNGIQVELCSKSLTEDSDFVPVAIVQYVVRTGTKVILTDAAKNAEPFGNSEYIQKHQPKSVLCLPILRQMKPVGFLYLENTSISGVFTPDRLSVLELLASQAAISIENGQLLTNELEARRSAEQEKQKQAFLAKAGQVLSESLEFEQVLEKLGQLVVSTLGDWCEFDMLEGDQIQRHPGLHTNPQKRKLLDQLVSFYPPSWESPHPSVEVLRSRKPMLIAESNPQLLRKHTVDEQHAKIIRELGTKTAMIIPLQSPRRLLGAMTIGSEQKKFKYTEEDLALVLELAKLASFAIDNSLLYRETQTSVQLRDDFISIASHELRTPLTPMKLQIEMVKRQMQDAAKDPSKMEKLAQIIGGADRQIGRLENLVNEMLDVSRMRAGQIVLDIQHCDFSQLIKNVLQQYQPEFTKYKTPVHVNIPESVMGYWDDKRLEQVIVNLISNAIKYGRENPIHISLTVKDNKAIFAVKDNGIGISKSEQKKLFARFVRLVSVKHYGGLGLGLFIVRQIVDAHHGDIQIESEVDQGATFTVTLPLDARS